MERYGEGVGLNRFLQGYAEDPLFRRLAEELEQAPEAGESGEEDKYFDMLRSLKEMAHSERGVPKWQFILTKRIWELMKERKTKMSDLANYKAENSPCLDDGESIGKANLTGYLRTQTTWGETNKSLKNMSIKALLLCSEFFDVSTDYLVGKTDLRKQRNIRIHTTSEKQREFWEKTDLKKQQSSWVKRGVGISEEALDTLRNTNNGVLSFIDFLLCQPEIVETVKKLRYHVEVSAFYRRQFDSYSSEVRDLLLRAFERYWENHVSPRDFRSYMLNIEEMLQDNGPYDALRIVEEGIGNSTRDRYESYVSILKDQLWEEDLHCRCLSLALAEETFELLEYKATQAEGMNNWNHDLSKMLEKYVEDQIKLTLDTWKEQEAAEQERRIYG